MRMSGSYWDTGEADTLVELQPEAGDYGGMETRVDIARLLSQREKLRRFYGDVCGALVEQAGGWHLSQTPNRVERPGDPWGEHKQPPFGRARAAEWPLAKVQQKNN